MAVTGLVPRVQGLFRQVGGVDVDKNDVKRYQDFINENVFDLLLAAGITARSDGRDVVRPTDLPLTRGMQENIQEFREVDGALDLVSLLEELITVPTLDVALDEETEARLPEVVGGLSVALVRTFRIVQPELKNPDTEAWERASEIFRILV
ncbi:MAG: DUF1931 family protein [Micromonosporaceae bacterium]|jgi:hypothetical protein